MKERKENLKKMRELDKKIAEAKKLGHHSKLATMRNDMNSLMMKQSVLGWP